MGELTSDELDALLQEAKAVLTIPHLWRHFKFPGEVHENHVVHSPFRKDKHASFSIFADGERFMDHGDGNRGDAYDFFQLGAKLDSKAAFKPFIELAGFGNRLGSKQGQNQECATQKSARGLLPEQSSQSKEVSEFKAWPGCVGEAATKISELVKERALSESYAERLVALREIGSYNGCWAFPVKYGGKVVAVHCRVPPEKQGEKADWYYYPKLRDLGISVQPYILGLKGGGNAGLAHNTESIWDALTLDDKLDISASGALVFCTRGAQNAKLFDQLPASVTCVACWAQNDEPGKSG